MPQEARVKRAIERETAWTTNVPFIKDVLLSWEPCEEPSVDPDDVLLINRVNQQKWKGLAIKQIEGKGKGVIATMTFKKNQIVCDYHGAMISKQEGERRLETLNEEPLYLFFFKGKAGEPLCIDAQEYPCDCHPDQDTYGWRMNHSRRNSNVRPQRVSLNLPDGARECVVLLALRDIDVNEELLWDYGSSFGGEGRDLSWPQI
ncbi:putative N-lysine methyltransferase SETD8-A-like [Triplophysa rosa]|uniref:N-lysine methyltransferase SETD8-A-like n=1 Tax=Triplophysa rosa TaxID=992332 RepID=A0A9W7T4D6_TRIRA|nr:putative N-lysine methyltransferase SETD8-A-like [Triplophysa rosa]